MHCCESTRSSTLPQLRNDYQLGVFNGEMGTISFVDPDEHEVGIALEDGRTIRYPWASLSALTHAFATSR